MSAMWTAVKSAALPAVERADRSHRGPSAARAVERRHAQRGCAGSAAAFPVVTLASSAGEPHLLEQVEAVVRGRAVGAERDVDVVRKQLGDRRDAARELQVRGGAMDDVTALRGEQLDLRASRWTAWMAMKPVRWRRGDRAARAATAVRRGTRRRLLARFVRRGSGSADRAGADRRRRRSEGRIADRVRRMRRQRERQPSGMLVGIARGETPRQVASASAHTASGNRDRHAEHRAHPGVLVRARGGVGEEIHVVAAGDAAAQHLGCADQRAVVDEFGRDEAALARPDVALQPGPSAGRRRRCRARASSPRACARSPARESATCSSSPTRSRGAKSRLASGRRASATMRAAVDDQRVIVKRSRRARPGRSTVHRCEGRRARRSCRGVADDAKKPRARGAFRGGGTSRSAA